MQNTGALRTAKSAVAEYGRERGTRVVIHARRGNLALRGCLRVSLWQFLRDYPTSTA